MLTFGKFKSDMGWGCVVHAQSGTDYLDFAIPSLVLTKLGVSNPVHHEENEKVCEDKRDVLEPAYQRALERRPGSPTMLELADLTTA